MGDEASGNPDRDLVRRHVAALRSEAGERGVPDDVLGRLLLQEVTGLWLAGRSVEDVARELHFVADTLDPDTDFEFMRP